jgi:DNA-damage-inducible protein J
VSFWIGGSTTISVTAETKSHDAWFRSRVQEALKDPRPPISHAHALHQLQTLIDEKRQEQT